MSLPKAFIKIILLIILLAAVIFAEHYSLSDYLSFESLKKNRDFLKEITNEYYTLSVIGYILLYISTAFFVPAAIPLTIIGGFLFGVFWGTIYACIGAIVGASLSFYTAKYLLGDWLQNRYKDHLKRFNKEVERHGYYYLILIRLTPLLPFFLINYLAGLTMIPFKVFLLTFLVTLVPGSVIYTFAGQHLGSIESYDDLISLETLLIIVLLLFILLFSLIVYKYIIKGNLIRQKG